MRVASLVFLVIVLGCGTPATQCPPTMASGPGMHEAHGEMHEHHHDHVGHTAESMQHDFSDVARFEAMFDAPDRSDWQRPTEVVAMLEIVPGQTVVDLGTGTGYFLPFLSVAVGVHGHVIALDNEPAMIEHVIGRAVRQGMANVEARVVQSADPALGSETVDHVLVVDTWHHLPDRAAYASHLRDALRPGGTLVVVDFTVDATRGPPVADRISPEAVALELTNAGLEAEVLAEGLPEQYAVRGRRPSP